MQPPLEPSPALRVSQDPVPHTSTLVQLPGSPGLCSPQDLILPTSELALASGPPGLQSCTPVTLHQPSTLGSELPPWPGTGHRDQPHISCPTAVLGPPSPQPDSRTHVHLTSRPALALNLASNQPQITTGWAHPIRPRPPISRLALAPRPPGPHSLTHQHANSSSATPWAPTQHWRSSPLDQRTKTSFGTPWTPQPACSEPAPTHLIPTHQQANNGSGLLRPCSQRAQDLTLFTRGPALVLGHLGPQSHPRAG